ncbi:carboxypeptidase-like regulatory domain-containing protein [Hymenobacter monticola]|uniref:Carboxypeptidase-like regulatory domain-containing protein n=1 Tax=Hymenobacter monticola TaxID=1705399 RepID=A0ABY4B695_9BACT|nr:carboxypeptidase-like regulatory domain-containing protein [Hymenobacter monticola]UOE34687.1 carboxypeptidase-like regulatory domain-containing protein [Hymenobacter monticola]
MRLTTFLHIPQPCSESWDAMRPVAQGRHCAACQKTVVDFTHKTDAEILALLAGAAGGRTCGRFAAGQLGRPLQRATPAAPMPARWRTWLAAATAVWGVREGTATETKAQVPAEWRARYWGGPVPSAPPGPAKETTTLKEHQPLPPQQEIMGDTVVVQSAAAAVAARAAEPLVLRGTVTDASTHQGLPYVTILFNNTLIGTVTNADGAFELPVPAQLLSKGSVEFLVNYVGYKKQQHTLPLAEVGVKQQFQLQVDDRMMGEVVITAYYSKMPPAPWHPRRFYNWSKYWLTRPFRRG